MSANPLSGPAPLTVTFNGSGSTDPDGSVTSWLWSFGDGTSGTGAVVTHTYTTIGITYYPSLTVVDNRGASNWVAGSPIVVNAPLPPAAPSLLTASSSGASVLLNWQDNSTDEIGFYIERCEGAGCTDFQGLFGDTPANVTTFTDSSVTSGITYRYRVVAYNAGGYSPYSNIATISAGGPILLPIAPSNLVGQGVSRSQIALTWTNNNKIQDGVMIERCQGSTCTNFVQIAAVAGTATTYNDSGLTGNTTYRYRVRASNSSGNSPYSNIDSVRTLKR
jgi:chitodextrinase